MLSKQVAKWGIKETCLVKKGGLNKNGCKVGMKDFPKDKVVIDFDKPGAPLKHSDTRCDYLVVADCAGGARWLSAIELKSGRARASKVIEQLQAGADAAEQMPLGEQLVFRPVVFGTMSKYEREELKKKRNKIKCHGKQEAVRVESCGEPLVKVFNKR